MTVHSYERRCRLLMLAYPPRHRQAHADVFAADPECRRPPWGHGFSTSGH